MIIHSDLHIHTHCSCDSACAQLPDIVQAGQQARFAHWGISDHLHTRFNLPDIEIAAREFRESGPVRGFHFGLEITCATLWECRKIARRDYTSCFVCELNGVPFRTMTPIDGVMFGGPPNGPLHLDITAAEIDRLGIEYVIGGVHKPNYTELKPRPMIDDFFNQSCYLIRHELVDILAHPWDMLPFWSGNYLTTRDPKDRDYQVLRMIPREYWDELERLLLRHRKLAEINNFILFPEVPDDIRHYYLEKLAQWRSAGVKFSYGSDLHGAKYQFDMLAEMDKLLVEYGFTEGDFALPLRLRPSPGTTGTGRLP